MLHHGSRAASVAAGRAVVADRAEHGARTCDGGLRGLDRDVPASPDEVPEQLDIAGGDGRGHLRVRGVLVSDDAQAVRNDVVDDVDMRPGDRRVGVTDLHVQVGAVLRRRPGHDRAVHRHAVDGDSVLAALTGDGLVVDRDVTEDAVAVGALEVVGDLLDHAEGGVRVDRHGDVEILDRLGRGGGREADGARRRKQERPEKDRPPASEGRHQKSTMGAARRPASGSAYISRSCTLAIPANHMEGMVLSAVLRFTTESL